VVVVDVVVEVEAVGDADAEGFGVDLAAGVDGNANALELAIKFEGELVSDIEVEAAANG
jgi:hypothetical protein